MIITIDGPTASGKSTIARTLAQQINFFYLSSGILYRGLAYCLCHERNYDENHLKDPDPEVSKKALLGLKGERALKKVLKEELAKEDRALLEGRLRSILQNSVSI